jgi:hypothetical protein
MPLQVLHIDYAERLVNKIKHSESEDEVILHMKETIAHYELVNFSFNYSRPFVRARICDSGRGFNNTSEIYYPPTTLTTNGRANDKLNPCLYLSLKLETATLEIGAKEGDVVQVALFKTKNDQNIRLGMIGEKINAVKGVGKNISEHMANEINRIVNEMSMKDRVLAMSYVYLDGFFNELLTDHNACKNDYLFSRTTIRLLHEKYDFLDGFMYHSNSDRGAHNIVVPAKIADEKLGLVDTLLVRIKKVYDYGLIDYEIINTPTDIKSNGDITWS